MLYELEKHGNSLEYLKPLVNSDILVGIPSFRNENTIGSILQITVRGLLNFFSGQKSVIMNSDGGSPDDTVRLFKDTDISGRIDRISSFYGGDSEKDGAVENIFLVARFLNVKAVLILDSDLRSITPQWVKFFLEPILRDELDYVTPFYSRHKYDGTLTDSIAYPLTRALYGADIRQPMGGEFAISGNAFRGITEDPIWHKFGSSVSGDLKLTVMSVVSKLRTGQASLGVKNHDAKDPSILSPSVFNRVIGACFDLAGEYSHHWAKVEKIEEVPLSGDLRENRTNTVNANYRAIIRKFVDGYRIHHENWTRYLSSENRQLIDFIMDGIQGRSFSLDDRQWARIVYDFLVSYHKFGDEKELLIESLTPLYFLKIADFINKTEKIPSDEAENLTLQLADRFLSEKEYLIKNWSSEIQPLHALHHS